MKRIVGAVIAGMLGTLFVASPAQASAGLAVDPIAPINVTRASTTIQVHTLLRGSYDLHWSLTKIGSDPAEVIQGSVLDLPIGSDGALQAIVVDGSAIADGDYKLEGTVTIRDPDAGTVEDTLFYEPPILVDRVAPKPTISLLRRVLYPRINSGAYRTGTTITMTGDKVARVQILSGSTIVWDRLLTYYDNNSVWWWGTNIPAGVYTVVVFDAAGNLSPNVEHLTVSNLHAARRTWTKVVTARGSMVDKYVGRCSTLKIPSARGWRRSLGLYANTRCGTQTGKASAVNTLHAAFLPAGYRYLSLHVDVYGAPARGRPRDYAMLGYPELSGHINRKSFIKGPLGWHQAMAVPVHRVMYRDRSFAWILGTAYRNRYDVAKFRIVLDYYVLTTSG